MKDDVLIDSCFYIDRMRSGLDPFDELNAHKLRFNFLTCGTVMTEVLRGIRVRKKHRRVKTFMDVMIYVPTINAIWERVARLAWQLDRQGFPMQVTDLVIAASALHVDATVLTLDTDFQRVPKLRVMDKLP